MRGFLADKKIDHAFVDVRKAPIAPKDALALIRQHRHAIATRGGKLFELEVAKASDDELLKLFLGREGTLRAPTVSDGTTLLGGFDEKTLARLAGKK